MRAGLPTRLTRGPGRLERCARTAPRCGPPTGAGLPGRAAGGARPPPDPRAAARRWHACRAERGRCGSSAHAGLWHPPIWCHLDVEAPADERTQRPAQPSPASPALKRDGPCRGGAEQRLLPPTLVEHSKRQQSTGLHGRLAVPEPRAPPCRHAWCGERGALPSKHKKRALQRAEQAARPAVRMSAASMCLKQQTQRSVLCSLSLLGACRRRREPMQGQALCKRATRMVSHQCHSRTLSKALRPDPATPRTTASEPAPAFASKQCACAKREELLPRARTTQKPMQSLVCSARNFALTRLARSAPLAPPLGPPLPHGTRHGAQHSICSVRWRMRGAGAASLPCACAVPTHKMPWLSLQHPR